jgi:hypothetical protein
MAVQFRRNLISVLPAQLSTTMRACQIQSAGACWLRASLRTARSSRSSCAALALTCLGISLLLPLTHPSTSYCSPFEEWSIRGCVQRLEKADVSST